MPHTKFYKYFFFAISAYIQRSSPIYVTFPCCFYKFFNFIILVIFPFNIIIFVFIILIVIRFVLNTIFKNPTTPSAFLIFIY